MQVVLHAQECQQVPHSNDASKGERELQNILPCLEEGGIRHPMQPLKDVPCQFRLVLAVADRCQAKIIILLCICIGFHWVVSDF